MCAVCLHFWCHSTGHATSPTLQAITKVFNDVTCPPRAASRWRPYVSMWTPLNSSNSAKKKGRSRKMKCFKQLQRRRKGRVSKSKLAFGNDAEVATVVIIKDSRGMKWTWYISVPISWQIYNELGILERIMSILFENGLLPPHYSKSQIFVQKFNFDKTFSRVFHTNSFWQFFSSNQMCQQLKSP